MTDKSLLFRKSTRQASCRINDDVAILDMEKSLYFRLEGVAVEVWDALDTPSSIEQLCERILARFEVSPAECETDITNLLEQLQAKGLVEAAA